MINIYYGHLRDATVTSTLNYETSYPLANIKVLNKNKYSYLVDSGSTTADPSNYYNIILLTIDMGLSADCSSWVLEATDLLLAYTVTGSEIIKDFYLQLYGSNDNTTYTLVDNMRTVEVDSDVFGVGFDGVYSGTVTEVSYRYYQVVARVEYPIATETETISWEFGGYINNLYIGDYAELPCPELKRKKSIRHGTKINEALGGGRSGYYTHARRQAWTIDLLLSETQKDALEDMDEATYGGALPVYFEEEGLIDPIYARVTGEIDHEQDAYQYYRATLTVEEEL